MKGMEPHRNIATTCLKARNLHDQEAKRSGFISSHSSYLLIKQLSTTAAPNLLELCHILNIGYIRMITSCTMHNKYYDYLVSLVGQTSFH